jgi:hypothetical protein
MSPTLFHALVLGIAALASRVAAAPTDTPPDAPITPNLAGAIQITHFGERPFWHPDGTKFAFLHKSYGDVMTYDLVSAEITTVSAFRHHGINRVHYLPNGDFLLTGAAEWVPSVVTLRNEELHMIYMSENGSNFAVLDQKILEGPAISRTQNKISWINNDWQYPEEIPDGESRLYVADLQFNETGYPSLVNKRHVATFYEPECLAETQDFFKNDTMVLISCYTILRHGRSNARVDTATLWAVDLETGEKIEHRGISDETRISEWQNNWPNAPYATIQSDIDITQDPDHSVTDLWRIRIEPNTTDLKRLTYFGNTTGFLSGNPAISPDAKWMVFQVGRAGGMIGTGHGLFIQELEPVDGEW